MKYQAPRGTQDILPEEAKKLEYILNTCKKFLQSFSYQEILTPIFEHTDLFVRSVGESSDIVNKEMYTFLDRSDRSLTLRPEATAGVLRAYIENGMSRNPKPVKLWSFGPMFRYERSQTGRYRQFHQINIEILGDGSLTPEIESIFLINKILNELKIKFKIDINSLGDSESKKNYKEYFTEFTKNHLSSLCDDCKRRFEQNPLRMLDCKVEADQKIYLKAKKPIEFLSSASKTRWEELTTILLKKDFIEINHNLVRGLDYYNDFVFEIKSISDDTDTKSLAIGGGGRYDKLVKELGGEDTPGFGFAFGIERLLLILKKEVQQKIKILVLTNNEPFLESLITQENNLEFDISFNPQKIGRQIETALKKGAKFIIFYLDEEYKKGIVKIKNLETREEFEVQNTPNDIMKVLR